MSPTHSPLCLSIGGSNDINVRYADTGDASGEGSAADHTVWGIVRDHKNKIIYWRDATNPSFRRLRLQDIDFTSSRVLGMILEAGPFYTDVSSQMKPVN